jgi:Fe-S-cluster containining protein
MTDARIADTTTDATDAVITCASCKACCCKLEVMLMSEDDVPLHLTEEDRWGGRIMAREDDGWCAALDRETLLCGIYERRPAICRDYEMGGTDCIAERSERAAVIVWQARPAVGSG